MSAPKEGGFEEFDFESGPSVGVAPVLSAFDQRVARRVQSMRDNRGKAKAPPSIGDAEFGRARLQAGEMARSGDWSRAMPRHLVALYDLYHERVYGVHSIDLTPIARGRAAGMVGQLLRKHFGMVPGEAASEVVAYVRAAAFVRWAWEREAKAEKWRQEVGRSGRRLGWVAVFGGQVLADYAVESRRLSRSR